MRSRLVTGLSLLCLAAAGPAFGGAVYIPYTADITVGGIRYETQIWAANRGTENRRFSAVFLNAGSDGTDRDGVDPTQVTVLAGGSVLIQDFAGANQLGMLEISGAPQLAIGARLVPIGDQTGGLGASLPVISSENLLPAGATVYLQGLGRDDQKVTDFVLANIEHTPASCNLSILGANGAALAAPAQVTVAALSINRYTDLLGSLDPPTVSGARVVVSCDKRFFAYALTFDAGNAGVKMIQAAELLTSTLAPPGTTQTGCPAGALCFSKPGTFFTQVQPATFHIEYFDVPPGNYRKVHFEVDVYHGGWGNLSGPGGLHSLFWLVRDRNFNLLGFSVFRKPPRNDVMFRHGIGIEATQKPKIFLPVEGVPGHTYRVSYTYDPGQGRLNYQLTDLTTGALVIDYNDVPNVNRVEVPVGSRLRADFGFKEGLNENEDPGYGWRYSNLKLEAYP